MKIKSVLQLLRLHQWSKNAFIFLPLFFHGQFGNKEKLYPCILAFIAFSLAASSIYCFNDLYDVEQDRIHPRKRKRPIASGLISKKTAYTILGVCLLISMLLLMGLDGATRYPALGLIAFYYVMNIAYCISLKYLPIVDVTTISVGFVLRVWVGGVVAGIVLSEWIVLMTFLLALFLAFAKRRDDIVIYQATGVEVRKNTNSYTLEFINQIMTVVSTITIVAYIMYTLSPDVVRRFDNRPVYFTTVFVLIAIIRYLQLTIVHSRSGSPTKILLHDRFIQACILGWIGLFLFIIYL
jgi:4-hydroxybenzoate polyprenyltransferase